ncbi:hypothetical protein NXV20_24240 [Bacteroides thetaiotaomicron]|uniref:hypothetical protein n=1 Tax=Bacteroides thetaiotaomicron TaxID=818 RepID=UPI002165B6C9|nr:hypothetical protein [Bacteroides thetaiotaomicron]MCS2829285.1 hypothetical protein [Bacteroides thetaiotaomicron]
MKGRRIPNSQLHPQTVDGNCAADKLTMVIIVFNLYGLYTRMVTVNLLATLVLLLIGKLVFLRPTEGNRHVMEKAV